MPGIEEKFTPRLRQALIFATQEAVRFRQESVAPEHLLLGMLREGTGLATVALSNLGAEPGAVRASVEATLKPGQQPVRGDVGQTPEAKAVLELAAVEAESLNSTYIGQEHLLLALLRHADNAAAEAIAKSDVTYELARAQVIEILFKPAGDGKAKVKRYNLALPEDLFRDVEQLAERDHTTVLEVIRRSVKLGLLVAQLQQNQRAQLIVREDGRERQLVVL